MDVRTKRGMMKSFKTLADDIQHRQKVDFIRMHVSDTARYMMLAEEAAEVAQAAAKLARIFEGSNPTPKTLIEAREDLAEEMNDIWLSYEVATGDKFRPERGYFKVDRCVERICESRNIPNPYAAD